MRTHLILFILIGMTVLGGCWPSYRKNGTRQSHSDDQINTAMVHNDCCPIGGINNGPIIEYPNVFTHEWDMWTVDNCY
jgi:hypothetical protein